MAGQPRQSSEGRKTLAPFAKRFAGARAIARHPRLIVSDIEKKLGTRYTIDTLAAL